MMASSGRGMTCALTSSPTRLAASAPASTAARTLPTSPRTTVVTNPPPTCTRPPRLTLAALSMASVPSIIPTRPLVSIRPRASPLNPLPLPPTREPARCTVAMGSGSVALGCLGGGSGRRLGEGEHAAEVLVRARDHLDADDLADPAGGRGAGVDGRLDRGHVTGHEGRHQAAADLLPADEVHVRGLDHRVAGFHHRHETFRLDHAERFERC